jgi:hypothetical protein
MKLTGQNRSTRGKTCPSATVSTINPTWTDPGSNPSLRGGRFADLLSMDLISKPQTLAIAYGTPGTTRNTFRVPAERNRRPNQLPLPAPAVLI